MSRDFNRFDWVEALLSTPELKKKPGAVRVGVALAVHYYNEEKGLAWPSRAELARKINSAPQSVSLWLSDLRDAGAIRTDTQARAFGGFLKRKSADPRSLFYRLDFDWAVAVLEAKKSDDGLRGEPVRKVTKTVTDRVTKTVTDIGHEDRYTEPLTSNQREPDKKTRPEREHEWRAAAS